MASRYYVCPKCGHRLNPPRPPEATCPACGIYFFKWAEAEEGEAEGINHPQTDDADSHSASGQPMAALGDWGRQLLIPLPRMSRSRFVGRCLALLLLGAWSWRLIGYDVRTGEINQSFMHAIVLPIHEAGHVLFIPFGQFMTILGGSLFQLLLPFAIGTAFILRQRDAFGAALCSWWTAISLIDLSPYIYDALKPQMVLVGGHTGEDGPHDWIYLLQTLGQLAQAQAWGRFAHTLGALLALAALAWAALILWRQRDRLDDGLDIE